MEIWLSYAPGDFLMFGPEVYWRLFALHTKALWPLPGLAFLLGVAALPLLATRRGPALRIVLLLTALGCLGASHFLATRYAPINWIAGWAAWLFGLQAAALAVLALYRPSPPFRVDNEFDTILGWGLIFYATILHPVSGAVFGRPLIMAEIVGLAPDATAIACLGFARLLLRGWPCVAFCAIPLLWCTFSAATLLTLGEAQAWILITITLLWVANQLHHARRAR